MDDKGGNVIDLKRSKVSIRDLLGGTPGIKPVQPAIEKVPERRQPEVPVAEPPGEGMDLALPEVLDPLPGAGDAYVAHARAANKPLLSVTFLLRDGTNSKGFAYSTYDSIDRVPGKMPGEGPGIVIRFAGHVPTEVTLEGRNLNTLYSLFSQHRVAWVRERGERDFITTQETVVTRITFNKWEG